VIPQKSSVTLSIYDMSGKLVSQLIKNETKTEGSYTYEFDGNNLSSGMYVYKLSAGKYTETRKMILLK
jgi:flagellar hook assembly protein FlgD